MKIGLDPYDVEELASAVAEKLKPLVSGIGKEKAEDIVFDKKGLSEYLKVSESTISKMVGNKQIPHFKIQSGQSGGVRFFKKDIDKWICRQTIPEISPLKARVIP